MSTPPSHTDHPAENDALEQESGELVTPPHGDPVSDAAPGPGGSEGASTQDPEATRVGTTKRDRA